MDNGFKKAQRDYDAQTLDDGFRKVAGQDYEVFEGLDDEEDGSELIEKLHNDNITLTARVHELEDERDEFKSANENLERAYVEHGIEQNKKIDEANRLLSVAFKIFEPMHPSIFGRNFVAEVRAHLKKHSL